MRRAAIFFAAGASLMAVVAEAQSGPVAVMRPAPARGLLKDGPSFEIACTADTGGTVAAFAEPTATIWIPMSFNTTNARTRLKFYDADIQFVGDATPLRIGKAVVTGAENETGQSRFGDLRVRAADDDFPTTFTRGGQLYEIQATSSLPRRRTGQHSFAINFKKSFSLLIESAPSDGSARALAWAGSCTFSDPKEIS
jgi:hypothetical protein